MVSVHGVFSGFVVAAILSLALNLAAAQALALISCAGFLGMLAWKHGR